jgi:hypothetical protein
MAECRRRAANEPDLASSDSVDVERSADCAHEEDETGAAGSDEGRGARILKTVCRCQLVRAAERRTSSGEHVRVRLE